MQKQWKTGVLLFDYVDVLDYSGPFEVFSLTVREANQVQDMLMNNVPVEEKPFLVKTISQSGQLITAHNGLKILPDFSFDSLDQKLDLLIVPGGPLQAIKSGVKNSELLHWITSQYSSGTMIASVCTGAILLAEAGILSNKKATTNTFALDYLEQKYADVEVVRNVRYVDNGDVLTSAGVSAGIDMSLYIVEKLLGIETARTTSTTIEYPFMR